MPKQNKTRDPENTARGKLADAQAKLHAAQERRTGVVSAGDLELETVRRRIEKRIDKATKVVERRAGKVARAEARLLKVQRRLAEERRAEKLNRVPKTKKLKIQDDETAHPQPVLSPTATAEHLEALEETASEPQEEVSDSPVPATASPVAAADHLAQLAESAAEEPADRALVTPGEPTESAAPLDEYAQRILVVLRDEFGADGATFTEWLAVAGMSKRTFLRARKAVVDAGLAEQRGSGQGSRYFATSVG